MMADALEMSVPVVKTGDTEARLTLLFDAHHRRLYGLARRLSPSAEDARDLVQDTYLRASQKLRSVPFGASKEEAWLVRVLVNLCRDHWRQRTVRQRHAHHLRDVGTESPSGEAAIIAKATVWQALESLSPRRRAVLVMCELEGLSISSVAETLGLAAVTVRWHLSRGRRELIAAINRTKGNA
jgi:RNA polymerase sigma-70 factor (ECF subfamily)